MHPNPVYHSATEAQNLAFARGRGFGVLAVAGDPVPMLSHVPFLVSGDGSQVDLHLVRSNPIVQALHRAQPARIAVSGPDSYVSPDWYGMPDQVPTWNYVAVHLTGTLELRPQDELRGLLDQLSAEFESRLAPKLPWTADKMPSEALERMMRMIVPCRMAVTAIDGTWKLAQNKPEAVRQRAADRVATEGIGSGRAALADLMRGA